MARGETDDPAITVFNVTANAGMAYYANDSTGRLAPLYRRWADAAASDRERLDCLRWAEAHEKIAADYFAADRIMTEVEEAVKDERT